MGPTLVPTIAYHFFRSLNSFLKTSPSDIGGIGEGITGYYFQSVKKFSFEIRPFGVSPDIIFSDNLKKPRETI